MKLIATAIVLITFIACTKTKTEVPVDTGITCTDTVFFQNEILGEIMNVSCNTVGCHDAGTGSAGYTIENYSQVAANANLFLSVIRYDAGVLPMPQGSAKLADSLIQKLDCWIQQGKLDN